MRRVIASFSFHMHVNNVSSGEGSGTPLQYSCLENPMEPGRLQSMGSRRVGHDWATSLSLSCIGEGNCNPLQCSCLENPRDRGAWWEAVYGVTQSQTRLKWLSSSSSRDDSKYTEDAQGYIQTLHSASIHRFCYLWDNPQWIQGDSDTQKPY